MRGSPVEIEAKFAVGSLDPIRLRLRELAARQARPRLQETNLRFDYPDGRLQQTGQVLRIRKNHDACLTFKAPGPDPEHRRELEIAVDDAGKAERLLESLGLTLFFVYEKYRETFLLEDTEVMLDELPFGDFVEVEGDDLSHVRRTAEHLELAWEERLPVSYLGLFDRLRRRHAWTFRDATFANFEGVRPLPPEDLRAAAQAP
jgi:adenylate cyclase class 2